MQYISELIRNHHGNFVRFCFVGAVNTSVDFLVFFALLYGLSTGIAAAHICSFLVATCGSFLMNKIWTFKDKNKDKIMPQFGTFLVITGSGLGISTAFLLFLNSYMPVLIAKIITIGITLVWNYTGSHAIVFNKDK